MEQRLGYDAFALQSALRRADIPENTICCPTLIVASMHDALRSLDEANELVEAIPTVIRWQRAYDSAGETAGACWNWYRLVGFAGFRLSAP